MHGNEATISSAVTAIRQAMAADPPEVDGRRARSQVSRIRIIQAVAELVAEGDPNPSAAAIAERAGVGLRSVFRHFEDKDTIFREIDALLMKIYSPMLTAPYASERWQDQLLELVERRCRVNEAAAMFRISGLVERYRFKLIAENYLNLHQREKRMLEEVLPERLRADTVHGRMILIAASFDTWRMLRQDEQLSAEDAAAAIRGIVTAILACAGEPA